MIAVGVDVADIIKAVDQIAEREHTITLSPVAWRAVSAEISRLRNVEAGLPTPEPKKDRTLCTACGSDTIFDGRLIHYTDCKVG